MKRTFSRAKQKAIIKRYQRKARLSRNADVLIFLDYILFLKRLAIEANAKAHENKERTLQGYHINSVLKESLVSCCVLLGRLYQKQNLHMCIAHSILKKEFFNINVLKSCKG